MICACRALSPPAALLTVHSVSIPGTEALSAIRVNASVRFRACYAGPFPPQAVQLSPAETAAPAVSRRHPRLSERLPAPRLSVFALPTRPYHTVCAVQATTQSATARSLHPIPPRLRVQLSVNGRPPPQTRDRRPACRQCKHSPSRGQFPTGPLPRFAQVRVRCGSSQPSVPHRPHNPPPGRY